MEITKRQLRRIIREQLSESLSRSERVEALQTARADDAWLTQVEMVDLPPVTDGDPFAYAEELGVPWKTARQAWETINAEISRYNQTVPTAAARLRRFLEKVEDAAEKKHGLAASSSTSAPKAGGYWT